MLLANKMAPEASGAIDSKSIYIQKVNSRQDDDDDDACPLYCVSV